jgi:hypothetical protein
LSGKDHNGLFARWLPIASSGSKAAAVVGFCQRRFDLLAIIGMFRNRGWKLLFTYWLFY